MAYERPITIKKAIENIKRKHYVLPSIQREFVWDTEQIERLFDSLMRDYPISTFLFWKVEKSKVKDFQFYEFLKRYHEKKSTHNKQAEFFEEDDIIAVLDGQQRMTSLYLALSGTYAKKEPYFRWDSPHAFPEKKLYLFLLNQSEDIELEYDFKFLSDGELENLNTNHWFECSKILDFEDISMVMAYLIDNGLTDTSKYTPNQSQFALKTLTEFFNVIHQKGTISFFLEEGEELDKVLQIFIRINSGGTKLSYSDLLLSIATAKWEDKEAREVIHAFVDEINEIGHGFTFNKDFVLKSCLVLADLQDIKFKVDNFTKENMSIIEQKWEEIATAIKASVELVSKFGYSRDNLMATTALIPISYFIYKNKFEATIIHSSSREEDRQKIKEWLARVFLKGTFGGTPDAIYPVMRNIINTNIGRFPLEEVIEHYIGKRKSLTFSDEDIDSILNLKYGKARTYSALTLLYPGLNLSFKYHQDHIHPKSFFTQRALIKYGVNNDKLSQFIDRCNKLPNLQLLQATENIEKKNIPFKDWLQQRYTNSEDRKAYCLQNHITAEQSLKFDEFLNFYDNRKQILEQRLRDVLKVKKYESEQSLN